MKRRKISWVEKFYIDYGCVARPPERDFRQVVVQMERRGVAWLSPENRSDLLWFFGGCDHFWQTLEEARRK